MAFRSSTNPGFGSFKGSILLACASYNGRYVEQLRTAFIGSLEVRGLIKADRLEQLSVPGALELPQGLMLGLRTARAAASVMVALGCVLRGETIHYDLVCHQAARGLMNLSLKTEMPVINGILCCENERQAQARAAPKGEEFASAASYMAGLYEQ